MEKVFHVKRLCLVLVMALLFGLAFASSYYQNNFGMALLHKGYSKTLNVETGEVSGQNETTLLIDESVNGADNRYLHLTFSNCSDNATYTLRGYDSDGNVQFETTYDLKNGVNIIKLPKIKFASMAITFLGEGEIHCNLESVVLFKRYDGPQKYILTTFSGMVLFFVFYIVGVLVFAQNRVALLDVLRRGACILSFGKKNANISALLIGAMTVIASLPMAGERMGMALQILLLLLAIMMLPKKKPQKAEGVLSYAWVLFVLMTFVSGMMAPKVVPFISVYLLAMFCLAVRLQDLVPVARGVLFSIPVVMVLNFVMGSFDGSLPFAGAFSSSEKLGFYGLTLVLAGLYLLGKDLPKKDGLLLGCETFAIALGFVYLRRAWENRMLLFAAIALVLFFVLSAKDLSLLLKEKGAAVFAAPVVAFVGAVVVFLLMKMPGLYLNLDTSLREYSALADRSVDLNFWLPQWNLLGHSDMPEALAEAQMLAAPRFYNGLLQLFYDKGAYALVFAVMGFGGATWSLIRKKNWKEGILLLIFFLSGLSGNVEITGGNALYFFGYVLAIWLTNENDTSHTLC